MRIDGDHLMVVNEVVSDGTQLVVVESKMLQASTSHAVKSPRPCGGACTHDQRWQGNVPNLQTLLGSKACAHQCCNGIHHWLPTCQVVVERCSRRFPNVKIVIVESALATSGLHKQPRRTSQLLESVVIAHPSLNERLNG